ncbi:hypothetical protein EK904_014761 [Melospiza melodia maxima]|nr:hypothetical protein EK904_014761 [Melospiza melodia maxima]
MGLVGMCVHASPVPRQGKHLLSNGTGKDLFLSLQFLIMLWPDVKVVLIWHGYCELIFIIRKSVKNKKAGVKARRRKCRNAQLVLLRINLFVRLLSSPEFFQWQNSVFPESL